MSDWWPRSKFALTGGSLDQTVVGTAVPTIYGDVLILNTTTVANGSYTLQSVATDTAGTSGYSPGVQVTVDNPPPTTSVLVPSGGTILSGDAVLDATAADVGGVAAVKFALTGGSLDQTIVGTAVRTIYGYVLILSTTTVANGSYTLQSTASDTAGNTGYSPGVPVTIKN